VRRRIIGMKKKREKRSLNLIAEFEDGYAKGWHFAVGEYFKDPLDIKFTERKIPVLLNGEKQYEIKIVNGKERKKLITKSIWCWTQGRSYAFQTGYTIYDSASGYLPWPEAFHHFKKMIKIIEAVPCSVSGDIAGHVIFDLSTPASCRSKLDVIGQYKFTQHEFVEYLKTGILKQS
jgi:hypothetical protein